jgi:hypothetical protein
MRFDKLICTAFLLAAMLTAVQAGYFLGVATRGAAAKDAPRTAVIAEEKDGVVHVLVGGKEIVVIDETGLYVRGDVAYTGTLADGLPPHLGKEGGHAK